MWQNCLQSCFKFCIIPVLVVSFLYRSRQYVGQDYTQKRSTGAKVTLDQIDSVSVLAVR